MSEPTGLSQSLSSNLISNNSNTFTENSVVNAENSASFNSMTVTEASVGTEKFENSGNTNSEVHPPIETRSIIKTSSDSTLDSKTKKELEAQLALLIKKSRDKAPPYLHKPLEEAYKLFLKTGDINSVLKAPPYLHKPFNEVFRLFLTTGEVNKDYEEGSLLHHACAIKNKEICEILLKLGADINLYTEAGTPLYIACSYPKPSSDLIEFFLEKGANPNICANPNTWADPDVWPSPNTMYDLPSIYYTSRVPFIYISGRQEPTFRNPLLYCIAERPEIVELLIDKGADVNYQDVFRSKTYTPMYYAVASNNMNFDMIKLLLDKGANEFDTTKILNTAIKQLDITKFDRYRDHFDMIKLLLDKGANNFNRTKILNTAIEKLNIINCEKYSDPYYGKDCHVTTDRDNHTNRAKKLINLLFDRIEIPDDIELIAKRLLKNITIPTNVKLFENVYPNRIPKPYNIYNIEVILFVMVKFLSAKLKNNNGTIPVPEIDIKPFERILNITELLNQQKNNDSENILEDPKFKVIFMLRHLGAIQDPEQIKIIEQIFGFDPFNPLKLSQYCATVIIKAISNSDNVTDAINTLPLPKTIKDDITTLSLY